MSFFIDNIYSIYKILLNLNKFALSIYINENQNIKIKINKIFYLKCLKKI